MKFFCKVSKLNNDCRHIGISFANEKWIGEKYLFLMLGKYDIAIGFQNLKEKEKNNHGREN